MNIKATVSDQEDLRVRASTFTYSRIQDLSDIDVSILENGSVLVYNTESAKFTSTRTLENQTVEGGQY
jgi:hypothetical protein